MRCPFLHLHSTIRFRSASHTILRCYYDATMRRQAQIHARCSFKSQSTSTKQTFGNSPRNTAKNKIQSSYLFERYTVPSKLHHAGSCLLDVTVGYRAPSVTVLECGQLLLHARPVCTQVHIVQHVVQELVPWPMLGVSLPEGTTEPKFVLCCPSTSVCPLI